MKTNYSLTISAIAAASILGCGDPFRDANYPKGSLGNELNPHFRTFVAQCHVIDPDASSSRDYIPDDIWKAVEPGVAEKPAKVIAQTSSALLFLFPFTEDEIRAGRVIDPALVASNTTRALHEGHDSPIGRLDTADVAPLRASGALYYRQSCSSYLKAAADAKVDLPIASINSGLKTEFETHKNLLIFRGTFESPLHAALSTPGGRRRYAMLLMWSNFYNDPSLAGKRPYYLRSFRGTILSQATIGERSTSFNVNANAAGAVGVFNGDVSLRAGFGESASLDGNYFQVFLETERSPADGLRDSAAPATPWGMTTAPAPELSAISAELSQMFSENYLSPTQPMPFRPGILEHAHAYEVAGVPAQLCNDGSWSLTTTGSTVGTAYSEAPHIHVKQAGASAEGLPKCVFEIQGSPAASLSSPAFTQSSIEVTYKLNLRSSVGFTGQPPSAVVRRVFPVLRGPYPQIADRPVPVSITESGQQIQASWRFQVPLVDQNGLLNPTGEIIIESADPAVRSCSSTVAHKPVVHTKVRRGEDVRQLEVTVAADSMYSSSQKQTTGMPSTCTYNLSVRLPLMGGATYTVPVAVLLEQPFQVVPSTSGPT